MRGNGWNWCHRVLFLCDLAHTFLQNKEGKMVHHPKTNDEYNALKVNGKLVVVDFS